MPATSIAQQRLMAQAHGVRLFLDSKGKEGIDPKTLNKDYREEIVDLAKSMDPKDLKDFAQTKHEGLPKRILKKESIEVKEKTERKGVVTAPTNADPFAAGGGGDYQAPEGFFNK